LQQWKWHKGSALFVYFHNLQYQQKLVIPKKPPELKIITETDQKYQTTICITFPWLGEGKTGGLRG